MVREREKLKSQGEYIIPALLGEQEVLMKVFVVDSDNGRSSSGSTSRLVVVGVWGLGS